MVPVIILIYDLLYLSYEYRLIFFINFLFKGKLIFQTSYLIWLLPRHRRGLGGIVFTLSVCVWLCVCLSVCLSVRVSGQYFGILFIGY